MNPTRISNDRSEPRHPIRVVTARTGLTASALRAWERRYGAVEPGRSEGGQRLYSDADVERLRLLKSATDAGRAISQVAELEDDALREMVAEDRRSRPPHPPDERPEPTSRAVTLVEAALRAVEELDAESLESELRRGVVTLGARTFTDELVAPLLREIGARWSRGDLRPAHEHVASAVVERVLGWMLDSARAEGAAPVALIGTLPGEEHGLGALLAAATAALEGWRVTLLGRDLPPQDIGLAARRLQARVVGLSVVNPPAPRVLETQIRELLGELPPGTVVVAGGRAAGSIAIGDDGLRLRTTDTLAAFRALLAELAG